MENAPTEVTVKALVPEGWISADFNETCEPVSDGGRKILQKAYLKTGSYPIIDQGEELIGGFTDDASMLFQGETPVIAFGDHTRRFKLVDQPFVVGADGVKLIAPTGAWNARCLWYFLCALKFEDRGYSRHFQFLRKAKLPLPPLPEQCRIADALDELFSDLDAGVAALEQIKEKLKVYRASVLKAALEGVLTVGWRAQHPQSEPATELLKRILVERRRRWEEDQLAKFKAKGQEPPKNWKARYKEPIQPDTTKLPQLPRGWCWAKVEQLSIKVVDGVHKKPSYVSEGIPFVTVRNLTAGPGISFERLNYISPQDHTEFIKRAEPVRGDILISKDGTLGVIRVIEIDIKFSIFVSVALVKPVMREMSNFLGVALSSPQVQAQMVPKGSGLVHIHLEDLREDCIPLAPLMEQEVIVEVVEDQFSVIDHLEADLDAKLKNAQALRQAILHRAFTGQLVPQDPNEEPASELLKRIASEREVRAREALAAKQRAKKINGTRAGGRSRSNKSKEMST